MAANDGQARTAIARLDAQARQIAMASGGCQVTWRQFGKGEPLVLLHGGHGNWLHWAANIERLSTQYTILVPDLPGYGGSDMPAEASLASLVEATADTLNQLVGAATPIALSGFSFGGLVAANVAAGRGHVSRLVLIGPAGHGTARRPRGELRNWRDALQTEDTESLRTIMRHNLKQHMLYEPAAIDALAVRIHTDACLRTRFRSKEISRAGGLPDALLRNRAPVLLVWGEHDVTADPAALAPGLAAGVGCQSVVLGGVGHWAQYEGADQINQLMLDFLAAGTGNTQ